MLSTIFNRKQFNEIKFAQPLCRLCSPILAHNPAHNPLRTTLRTTLALAKEIERANDDRSVGYMHISYYNRESQETLSRNSNMPPS